MLNEYHNILCHSSAYLFPPVMDFVLPSYLAKVKNKLNNSQQLYSAKFYVEKLESRNSTIFLE